MKTLVDAKLIIIVVQSSWMTPPTILKVRNSIPLLMGQPTSIAKVIAKVQVTQAMQLLGDSTLVTTWCLSKSVVVPVPEMSSCSSAKRRSRLCMANLRRNGMKNSAFLRNWQSCIEWLKIYRSKTKIKISDSKNLQRKAFKCKARLLFYQRNGRGTHLNEKNSTSIFRK